MPTTTGIIAADADDGEAENIVTASLDNGVNFARVAEDSTGAPKKFAGWLRFTGITIPIGSTVNSATLKAYMVSAYLPGVVRFTLGSEQTPGNPTTTASVFIPTYQVGTITHNVTNSSFPPLTSKPAYALKELDVAALIQSLVTMYDYSNGEMVFYANAQNPVSSPTGYYIAIYNRNWGTATTSLGGMPKSASLVINYTAGAPADKTTFHHG